MKIEELKRKNLIEFLHTQIGEYEYPSGSNRVKYNDWYYERSHAYHRNSKPYAWCGTFVAYSLHWAGIYIDTDLFKALPYVPSAQNLLRARGLNTDTPQLGDVIIFDWNNDGFEEHIGFYLGIDGDKVVTIEGNTSPDNKGNQSNGGMVCKKRRNLRQIEGFYKVI